MATIALGVLGLLGVMLAVTGIFGMASYTVSKRLREIADRAVTNWTFAATHCAIQRHLRHRPQSTVWGHRINPFVDGRIAEIQKVRKRICLRTIGSDLSVVSKVRGDLKPS